MTHVEARPRGSASGNPGSPATTAALISRRHAYIGRPCGRGSLPTVGWPRYAPPAPQHRPSSSVRAGRRRRRAPSGPPVGVLDVAKMARILDDDTRSWRTCGERPPRQPFGKVRNRPANACRVGGAEQFAVFLHAAPHSGAVHHDQVRPGHRRHHTLGEPRARRRGRRARKRSAARPWLSRVCDPRARRPHHLAVARWVSRFQASITQPVNSQASARHHGDRRTQKGTGRRARDTQPMRHQLQPLPAHKTT